MDISRRLLSKPFQVVTSFVVFSHLRLPNLLKVMFTSTLFNVLISLQYTLCCFPLPRKLLSETPIIYVPHEIGQTFFPNIPKTITTTATIVQVRYTRKYQEYISSSVTSTSGTSTSIRTNAAWTISQMAPIIYTSNNVTNVTIDTYFTSPTTTNSSTKITITTATITMPTSTSTDSYAHTLKNIHISTPSALNSTKTTRYLTYFPKYFTKTTEIPSQFQNITHDCADIQESNEVNRDGIYRIYRPSCLNPDRCIKKISCDLTTNGGGWTIIQQRKNNITSFFRDWNSYKNGFGSKDNFWIVDSFDFKGNEYLHELTHSGDRMYHLLINLINFDGQTMSVLYDKFAISDEYKNYTLALGKIVGSRNDEDNLRLNRNTPFGTFDVDTDKRIGFSCGTVWRSGWWHDRHCAKSGNLNVPFDISRNFGDPFRGILWRQNGLVRQIKFVRMMIRPRSFDPLLVIRVKSRHRPLKTSYNRRKEYNI